MINDVSAIHFNLNNNGELVPDGVNDNKKPRSQTFSDALIEGINDTNIIDLQFGELYSKDGVMKEVYTYAGGGVTQRPSIENSNGEKQYYGKIDVTISRLGSVELPMKGGKTQKDTPMRVMVHEIVGHAVPWLTGRKGNAIDDENIVRIEMQNWGQREQDKSHTSIPE